MMFTCTKNNDTKCDQCGYAALCNVNLTKHGKSCSFLRLIWKTKTWFLRLSNRQKAEKTDLTIGGATYQKYYTPILSSTKCVIWGRPEEIWKSCPPLSIIGTRVIQNYLYIENLINLRVNLMNHLTSPPDGINQKKGNIAQKLCRSN